MKRLVLSLLVFLSAQTVIAGTSVDKILQNAYEQIGITVAYDPQYRVIAYPGGDVPDYTGVCTDVIIRAFRGAGIDLQKLIHEDMKANFGLYPQNWDAKKPDRNIDHRRVPNLMCFFKRQGASIITDFKPGDVVAWRFDDGLLHVGLVSDTLSQDKKRYLVIHNIGEGAQLEDVLFEWNIIGQYRYFDA